MSTVGCNNSGNHSPFTLYSTSGTNTNSQRNQSSSRNCNESKRHDNDQKALFHGVKSAFRMSRSYDGKEYGTDDPQYETAVRTGANVAISYLEANDVEYSRKVSFEYLRKHMDGGPKLTHDILSLFGLKEIEIDNRKISEYDLETWVAQSWYQINVKENHDDGARTMLAIAEAYLGERLYEKK